MSFISVIKDIGKGVVKAAPLIGGGVSALSPVAGAIFNGVVGAMSKAERAYVDVPKSGPLKKEFAISEFEVAISFAAELLAARGETLSYDKDALHRYIDAQSAALNALSELKASFNLKPPTSVPHVVEQAFR